MLLCRLFLCLTSPFIIIQVLSEYILSANKPVLLQRADLFSGPGCQRTPFSCLTSLQVVQYKGLRVSARRPEQSRPPASPHVQLDVTQQRPAQLTLLPTGSPTAHMVLGACGAKNVLRSAVCPSLAETRGMMLGKPSLCIFQN